MPLYRVRCNSCSLEGDVFRKIVNRDEGLVCSCGGQQSRLIVAPAVQGEISPYESPGTGKMITSRTQMKEDLKRSGAIMWEPGIKKDIARNREAAKEKAFAPVAAAVDSTVAALVAAGKLES